MLISIILAWLAVLLCLMTALKFIARISGNKKLNKFFHIVHIPFGWLLLIVSIIHGILAGNPSSSTLSDFTFAPTIFTINWGTGCIVIGMLLLLTYIFRKRLKKTWIYLHRFLTVAMLLCVILHIYDVGITLPDVIFADDTSKVTQSETTDYSQVDENTTDSESSEELTEPKTTFSGAILNDGTYGGSASAYNGELSVSVTVSEGMVSNIEVTSQNETPRFYEQGVTVLDSITSTQSLDVDTVSGATFTSAGLINAVYDALTPAVTSGTLDINQIDISQVPRHGH